MPAELIWIGARVEIGYCRREMILSLPWQQSQPYNGQPVTTDSALLPQYYYYYYYYIHTHGISLVTDLLIMFNLYIYMSSSRTLLIISICFNGIIINFNDVD